MDLAVSAAGAVISFLERWLAEPEVRRWELARKRCASSEREVLQAIRGAVAELLEAKAIVDRYNENATEAPDPFAQALAVLLQRLPKVPAQAGLASREQHLFRLYTLELLERCQRPRRYPDEAEDFLEIRAGKVC